MGQRELLGSLDLRGRGSLDLAQDVIAFRNQGDVGLAFEHLLSFENIECGAGNFRVARDSYDS